MTAEQFLTNTGFLLGAMTVLFVVEAIVPFHRAPEWKLRHIGPNLALTAATLMLNFAFSAGAVVITALLNTYHAGLLPGHGVPLWASVVIGVVVLDYSSYLAHWLMHKVPNLWRVHRVHHSDPIVDVTTAYRQHPFEGMVRFLFTIAPAWALGLPAEAVAVYRLLSASNALLEHTNIKLWQPMDTAISILLVTPNMHKVHHSREQKETDSNYGNIFALYDRLFGSFTPTSRATAVTYGLDGFDHAELQTFRALLRLPFQPESPEATDRRQGIASPGGEA